MSEVILNPRIILVSVKFVSAILGPEMGAPVLWTPGKNAFFLQEKPMSIKFLVFGGGGGFWTWGGEAPGSEGAARICPRKSPPKRGLWESSFLQGLKGKTHTQNVRSLREDTLGATCSAGPFCVYFRLF